MTDINRDTLNALKKEAVNGTKKFIRLKDARVKSFFWQATQKGIVVGVIRYKFNDSDKVFTVAEFGTGVNRFSISTVLAKARKVATEIKHGGDPQTQHKIDKVELALSNMKNKEPKADDDIFVSEKAEDYLRQNKALPASKLVIRRGLDEIVNAFGHKRIKDVTRDDVVNLLLKLQERGAEGNYSVAENCQRQGRAMWAWGLDRGGFKNVQNYFAVLSSFRKQHRSAAKKTMYKKRMTMDDVKEMADIHFRRFSNNIQRAIILQAYTAVRPSSATSTTAMVVGGSRLHVDWSEFNLDKGEWHISQNRMKGRERDHIINMPPQLVAHLRVWHKEDGCPETGLVVRAKKNARHPVTPSVLAQAYRDKCLTYTPHKWRHLISTYIAERGGREIADLILAHYTSNAYFEATRKDDREKWLKVWADKLDTLGFDKLLANA